MSLGKVKREHAKLKRVEDGVFQYCESLNTFVFRLGVEFGGGIFYGCDKLAPKTIDVGDENAVAAYLPRQSALNLTASCTHPGYLNSSLATLTCSRCKTTKYCSKSHQKLYWNIHKKCCRPPKTEPKTTPPIFLPVQPDGLNMTFHYERPDAAEGYLTLSLRNVTFVTLSISFRIYLLHKITLYLFPSFSNIIMNTFMLLLSPYLLHRISRYFKIKIGFIIIGVFNLLYQLYRYFAPLLPSFVDVITFILEMIAIMIGSIESTVP